MRNERYLKPKTEPKRIVEAAILARGRLWSGEKHKELIPHVIVDLGMENGIPRIGEQTEGFLCDNGLFVDRWQALVIARKAKQVPDNFDMPYLRSEDLKK
jgi:hypothetical protein